MASASENRADLIPILTGAAAETFVKNAEAAERSRGSIDFSRQCAELLTRTTRRGVAI